MPADVNSDRSEEQLPVRSPSIIARFFSRKLVSALYTAFVIGFIVYLLVKDWPTVSSAVVSAKVAPLLIAVALNSLALLLQSQTWAIIQRGSVKSEPLSHPDGAGPGFWDWTHYFLVGYLGRYIPGKVSMVLGRVLVLEPLGFSKRSVVSAALFENLSFLGAGLTLGLLGILTFSHDSLSNSPQVWSLGVASILLVLGVILSPVPELCLRLALRVLRRDSQAPLFSLSASMKLRTFILSCISNLGLGLSYAFLLQAISPVDLPSSVLLLAASVFMIAVVGGVLALFAPSGIGVREGIVAALLSSRADLEVALLAAVIMRLLMCVVEISLFLVARQLRSVQRRLP